jgi:hypothetical protein
LVQAHGGLGGAALLFACCSLRSVYATRPTRPRHARLWGSFAVSVSTTAKVAEAVPLADETLADLCCD